MGRGRPKWEGGDRGSRPECRLPAGFSAIRRKRPTNAGLLGWRRSTDCASLLANSLQTGNITGNFVILTAREMASKLRNPLCSHLLSDSLLKLTGKKFQRA